MHRKLLIIIIKVAKSVVNNVDENNWGLGEIIVGALTLAFAFLNLLLLFEFP